MCFSRLPRSAGTAAGTARFEHRCRTGALWILQMQGNYSGGVRGLDALRHFLPSGSTRRKNRVLLAYLKRIGYATILDYCEAMCRKSIAMWYPPAHKRRYPDLRRDGTAASGKCKHGADAGDNGKNPGTRSFKRQRAGGKAWHD